MSVYDPGLPQAHRVAYALVPGDEEIGFVAEDPDTLTRVIVLQLVAQLRADQLRPDQVDRIRAALVAEDWQEAIVAWMDATGRRLNVFPDEPVWTAEGLDEDRLRLELPLTPIFSDAGGR